MTDNEPTVRYWRDERGQLFHVFTHTGHVLAERDESWTEVVVMTPAELAAHTTAARADERERIAAAIEAVDPVDWALAGQHAGLDSARIARTPDPDGDNT